MIEKLNAAEICRQVNLPDGGAIVALDRLGKGDLYSNEERARNVFRIDADGRVQWRICSQFDAAGDPFTQIDYEDGALTAYRWDGGLYSINMETGVATPLILVR